MSVNNLQNSSQSRVSTRSNQDLVAAAAAGSGLSLDRQNSPKARTISTTYRYAFFNSKLGLVFKIHDGKINLVKAERTSDHNDGIIEYEEIPTFFGKTLLEQEEEVPVEGQEFLDSTIQPYSDDEEEELQNDKLVEQFQDAAEQGEDLENFQQIGVASKNVSSRTGKSTTAVANSTPARTEDSARRPSFPEDSNNNSAESSKKILSPPTVNKLDYNEIAYSKNKYSDNAIPVSVSGHLLLLNSVLKYFFFCFLFFFFRFRKIPVVAILRR
jgi:hypothetical protein